jgi:hypothetical protein
VNSIGVNNIVSNDKIIDLIVLSRVVDEQNLGFIELIELNRLQERVVEIAKNSGLKDAVDLLANQKSIRAIDHSEFDSLVNAKFQRAKIDKQGGVIALTNEALNVLKTYEPQFLLNRLDAHLSNCNIKGITTVDGINLIDVFLELLQSLNNQDLLDAVYNKLADPKWPHNQPVMDFIETNSLVDPERMLMLFKTGYARAIKDAAVLLFKPRLTWTGADALPLRKIIKIIRDGLPKPEPIESISILGKKSLSIHCAGCSAKTDASEAARIDQCPRCGAISFIIPFESKDGMIERLSRRVEVLEDLEREISS